MTSACYTIINKHCSQWFITTSDITQSYRGQIHPGAPGGFIGKSIITPAAAPRGTCGEGDINPGFIIYIPRLLHYLLTNQGATVAGHWPITHSLEITRSLSPGQS